MAGLVLIFLGNLCQGNWVAAFHHPFTAHNMQYYSDAIKIEDASIWLSQFNQIQPDLLIHAKTHPPFAVLLHYPALALNSHALNFMAVGFTILGGLSLLLLGDIFRTLGSQQAARFVLLFALIPAVNIYTAVSLDGIIAMTAAAVVAGMLRIMTRRNVAVGVLLFSAGLVVMNLITFGGSFILLASLMIGLVQKRLGDGLLLNILVGNIVLGVVGLAILHWGLGYNHIQAFLTASHLENPDGFLGFHAPLTYLMTRLANLTEIALFMSPAALAFLFQTRGAGQEKNVSLIFQAGLISLGLMFLAGAFRVGETARACLFIYPFLVLPLQRLTPAQLNISIWFAGVSTVIMQLIGGYVW